MTLVEERSVPGPQTHALVVGVGGYPHLLGGGDQRKVARDVPLKQLTSPPLSARAFADWLIGEHDCPEAPLGTVDLLLSPAGPYQGPAPPGGAVPSAPTDVEAATWANLDRAASAWWERCTQDPENIALAYFCGHGLEVENLVVLLEDFGSNESRPLENAVDIHATLQNMAACRARTTVFIVDACREVPRPLKDYPTGIGRSLFGVAQRSFTSRTASILASTSRGARAYADRAEVSRFTRALLEGLRGAAGEEPRDDDGWNVTIQSLHSAMSYLMRDEDQVPTLGGELRPDAPALHRLAAAPQVALELSCKPQTELSNARLRLLAQPPATDEYRREEVCPEPWTLQVTAGQYRLEAEAVGAQWPQPQPRRIAARPPWQRAYVEIRA